MIEMMFTFLQWSSIYIYVFLLKYGLSYFCVNPLNYIDNSDESGKYIFEKSLFEKLFKSDMYTRYKEFLFPLFRGVCPQLLALGYGCRELHADAEWLPVLDEHLNSVRLTLKTLKKHPVDANYAVGNQMPLNRKERIADELKALLTNFDSCPLSLQQLFRVAIRRAVGGSNFVNNMKRLAPHLSPALFKYVSEASEMLLTREELVGLLDDAIPEPELH